MYLKAVNGIEGEVTIPSIGATIGTTAKWTLTRREDRPSGVGVYVFRAVFAYFNPLLFGEDGYRKEINVRVGDKGYRIEQVPGSAVSVDPPVLTMEEVNVWPVEP